MRGPSTSKRQGRVQRLTRYPFLWMREDLKDDVLADALFRLGSWIASNCVDAPGPYRAAGDLLLRRRPRLDGGTHTLVLPNESTVDAAKRIGTLLDDSVLAIQGPPGSGKTFTGARMICELVRQGKKVGITAISHKVIQNRLPALVDKDEKFG
jgi:hypothetical protein